MMMFDMHPDVAATFFQGTNNLTGKEMTAKAGIPALCPGAVIDEAAFTPCGYSMNAVLDDCYSTIHITPEAACSYVSFETNTQMEDYAPLLRRVLETFRPQRFVLTMFGDDDAISCLTRPPTANRCYSDLAGCPQGAQYVRTSLTATVVEAQRQQCIMGCYSYQAPAPQEYGVSAM
jgi:S-adenosylmethionine decarboxylase